MITDIRKSLQYTIHDRITSPLSGNFLFSWCIWNWQLVYYLLLSNDDVKYKISYIEENYLDVYHNFLFPIGTTFFLVIIYPLVANGIYWLSLKFRIWKVKIKQDIEDYDFQDFYKSSQSSYFDDIVNAITEESDFSEESINAEITAFFKAMGLISKKNESGNKYIFTDKGNNYAKKFYLKQNFQMDKQNIFLKFFRKGKMIIPTIKSHISTNFRK